MRLKNLFILLFVFVTAVSCKDETKGKENEGQATENEAPEVNSFKVTLNVVAKKNDDFCLLYTEDGTLDFKEGIWKAVKGSDGEQTIEFVVPKEIFPTQLRMDFGKNQDEVLLKSIKFEYRDKVREIKGFEAGVFFRADASKCTYDATMGIIKPLVIDGKTQEISLYPNEKVLAAELPKLAK